MGLELLREAAYTALGLNVGIGGSSVLGIASVLQLMRVAWEAQYALSRFRVPFCVPNEARRGLILGQLVEEVVSRSPIDLPSTFDSLTQT